MRLKEIVAQPITDYVDQPDLANQLVEFIAKNAKPWMDATNWGEVTFYRGVRSHQDRLHYEYEIRKDRRPKDSKLSYHRAYNAVIKAAGGKANRSNSAFIVQDWSIAHGHGDPYVFMALGPFHSTYHPNWRDWTVYVGIKQLRVLLKDEQILFDVDVESSIRKLKKELAGSPTEKRIAEIEFLLSEKGKNELLQKAKDKLDKTDGQYWWNEHSWLLRDPDIYDPKKIRKELIIDGDITQASPFGEVMIQAETALMIEPRFYKQYVLPILLKSKD